MIHASPCRPSFVKLAIVLALLGMIPLAAQAETPLKILFIGNSFTNGGPVPTLVRDLATSAGLPTPTCVNAAVNSMTLEWHTTNAATLAYVDQGGWDYVVLQEYSTRPTDSTTVANANPAQFEHDVTWFYDRIKLTSPSAKIVLYETWARREDLASMYPTYFANRDVMQEQLNYWYHHAAFSYIPEHSTSAVKTDVILAPAGEVWHADYHGLNYNLHGGDLYHANATGEHVNALTIFGAIYKRQVLNLPGGGTAMEDYLRALVDQTNALYFGGGGTYNYRPGVFAGVDTSIMLPTNQVTLAGMVTDDGLPDPPAAVTVTWSFVSGPAAVTFGNIHATNSTVTLPVQGIYTLRLTADDGELTAYDDVTITVNPQGTIALANPSFEANVMTDGNYTNCTADGWTWDAGGTNAWGTKNPGATQMTAAAGNNALAAPGNGAQYLYMNSGQTSQTLSTTLQASMTYTLRVAVARRLETTREEANYYIRLYAGTTLLGETTGHTSALASGVCTDRVVTYAATASDPNVGKQLKIVLGTPDPHASRRLGMDNVRLYASPANLAPTVSAGGDATIVLPLDHVNLDGTVVDDGSPNPPAQVTALWTKVSGAGTVSFGNPESIDTTATFGAAGTYVLRLTASDGALSAYDEVTITVDAPAALLGDFSGDGRVDQADYTTWADHYGQADAIFPPGTSNGDGVVDQADYTTWADHYGQTREVTVSEPAAPTIFVEEAAIGAAVPAAAPAAAKSTPAVKRASLDGKRAVTRQAKARAR